MHYLVAIHHPDDYDPFAEEDAAMHQDIDRLNEAMVAAGIRVFVGGLKHVSQARSVELRGDGDVAVRNGAYLKCDEHVGGFWVLDLASEGEALEWGRKAAIACRAPVEIRPFH